MTAPASWAEVESRLACLLGGGEAGSAAARDFLVDAVRSRWRTATLYDLTPDERRVTLYGLSQAVWALEGVTGDLAFLVGVRAVVSGEIASRLGVAASEVDGPEFRLDPSETSRPTYREWVALADFFPPPTA